MIGSASACQFRSRGELPKATMPKERIVHVISSAPASFLESAHGNSVRASTPLSLFANVACCPPARVSSRGETQCRCYRNAPSAQRPLRCLCFPLDGVDSSEAQTDPTLSKKRRRPSCSPRLVFVLSERQKRHPVQIGEHSPKAELRSEVRQFSVWAVDSGGKKTKATLPTRRAGELVRHDRFLLRSAGRLRRGENRADSAEVASTPTYFPALGLRAA